MISIVMATYNGIEFLKEQLDSLLNQTVLADEVIFVDDVSSDSTIEFLNKYIKNHNLKSWKVIENKKNKGHYKNFMDAISYANGDLVFLCDQDDIWDINKVKVMSEIMNKNKDITCLKSRYDTINSTIKFKDIAMTQYKSAISYPDYFQQMTNSELGCQMCFRKEVIEFALNNKISEFQSFDYHDLLLSYISSAIGKNAIVEDCLLYHRYHENNATQKSTYKYCQDSRINRINLISVQSARMESLLKIMKNFHIENDVLYKVVKKILMNNNNRIKFLKGNLLNIIKISFFIKCYKEPKTFFGDILCGFGINKLFIKK